MTREQLQAEAAELRHRLREKEAAMEAFAHGDAIRNTSNVITINNTTIACVGARGVCDPDLVRDVRDYIARRVVERATKVGR